MYYTPLFQRVGIGNWRRGWKLSWWAGDWPTRWVCPHCLANTKYALVCQLYSMITSSFLAALLDG